MFELGVRIKNIEAGSLYENNIGVREAFRYTNAVMTNSLFLDFLLANGLKLWKGTMTRDIIGIDFECGSRSFEEELAHLENTKKRYEALNLPNSVNKLERLIIEAQENKELYKKKTKEEIREIFYRDGVTVKYVTKKKNGQIRKVETINYKMLFRSTGKAKKGSCVFIRDRLYNRAIDFLRMGITLPYENSPIVEVSAYAPLVASSIVGKVKIEPENILIIKDVDSFFCRNVVSIETDSNRHCVAKAIENYQVKNTLFDGQALIDSSIFPSWGNGYILLRHHFCKMAAFNTEIQQFFKDYYEERYETAQVEDMFGIKHYVKDIKLITTDNAMKWLKFPITYADWCNRVHENGCEFGIVKTAHKSKLGEVQRMSYQMVNALDVNIMENVMDTSVKYINALKTDDNVFLDYLAKNINFANDYDVLIALVAQDKDFICSEYFRQRRKAIISAYTLNFKSGHVNQNGDNLVIVGSPYAMLMASVGLDPEKDPTFKIEDETIQCYTPRFDDGEYLAEFRSPFNAKENMGYLHNKWHPFLEDYFHLGQQCIAVNMVHTDFQDRNNGSDMDSDSIYCTNQPDIVTYAKYCYNNYPTIVNNIPKEKQLYHSTMLDFAMMDNSLAQAQMAIGESSNLAQLALTYTYNFDDKKYEDYVCILSVLAQAAIDNAKRRYDIDIPQEIKRIKADMNIKQNGYPAFWLIIRKGFDKKKINNKLDCPMNRLCGKKIKKYHSLDATISMDAFFKTFKIENNRRKCKKVEELIQKYNLNIFEKKEEQEDYILLRNDFERLVNDIRQVYLSKNYFGLASWLIDRAFCITPYAKACANRSVNTTQTKLNNNRALLLKVLYRISPNAILAVFSNKIS